MQEFFTRLANSGMVGWDPVIVVFQWVLSYLRRGDIIEIGMGPYSSASMSQLANGNRKTVFHCDTATHRWTDELTPASKVFTETSDEFFKRDLPPIAVCLIDGCHSYEQVKKDFWNVDKILLTHGLIAMHDTYPPYEEKIASCACGDAYRFKQELRGVTEYDSMTFPNGGYPTSGGVTFAIKKDPDAPYYQK